MQLETHALTHSLTQLHDTKLLPKANYLDPTRPEIDMSKPAFSLGDLQQGAKSLNNAPEIKKKSAKGDDEAEENVARLSECVTV